MDSFHNKIQLEDISNQFQLVLDNIPARVFWKDLDLNFRGANDLYLKDIGLSSIDELIGKNDFDFDWCSEEAEANQEDDLQVIQSGLAALDREEAHRRPDGKIHWLNVNKTPLRDDCGNVIGLLTSYTDISVQKNQQITLEHQLHHDSLTRLPNRRFLQACINSTDGHSESYSALIFLDLDQFKTVNDSLGHEVGDEVLIAVSERLTDIVSARGIVGRLGGDEFSVLVRGTPGSPSQVKIFVDQLSLDIQSAMNQPYVIRDHLIHLSASIGATWVNDTGKAAQHYLKEADLAMYASKHQGRRRIHFYDASMQDQVEREHHLLTRLRRAVDLDNFTLNYQPVINIKGQIVGAEALIRWHDEELGQVSPVTFIPLAEKTGLIHPIGEWVIKETLSMVKRIVKYNPDFDGQIALNISALQYHQDSFVDRLLELTLEAGCSPSHIEVEITESVFLGKEKEALGKLARLQKLGFSISIDDFGTGYSSLSYLSRLPANKVKIDRSFISRMLNDPRDRVIVTMIIQAAKALGIEAVAEGVEEEAEFNALLHEECHYFQGFYFDRPLTGNTLLEKI